MKDLSVTKLIHENRHKLLDELSEIKRERANLPEQYKKPCVFLAAVVKGPRTKKHPAGTTVVKVTTFNVHGGHRKSATIRNLMRNGQFPIGYDFPGVEQIEREVNSLRNSEGVLTGNAATLATGVSPFAELQSFLEAQIATLMMHWDSSELKEVNTSLEQRAKQAEAEAEAAKQELERFKASAVSQPEGLVTVSRSKKNKEEDE